MLPRQRQQFGAHRCDAFPGIDGSGGGRRIGRVDARQREQLLDQVGHAPDTGDHLRQCVLAPRVVLRA